MARLSQHTVTLAGIFSRQGQLLTGGPREGFLQKFHPAARFILLIIVLLAISICKAPAILAIFFSVSLAMAIASFLDLKSIYRLLLIPLVIFAIPSWLFATLWYDFPVRAGIPFFLRTLASVTAAAVIFHSIGLRHIGQAMAWLRLPRELHMAWSMMVCQVAAFSELVADMAWARTARQVAPQRGAITRRQAGTQAAILFARTCRRGDQLTAAMESRRISETEPFRTFATAERWSKSDYALVVIGTIIALPCALL